MQMNGQQNAPPLNQYSIATKIMTDGISIRRGCFLMIYGKFTLPFKSLFECKQYIDGIKVKKVALYGKNGPTLLEYIDGTKSEKPPLFGKDGTSLLNGIGRGLRDKQVKIGNRWKEIPPRLTINYYLLSPKFNSFVITDRI